VDDGTPGKGEDAGYEQQRRVVEGLGEAHRVEEHGRLVVRGVVEDLHDAHGVDPLAGAEQHDGQRIVREAGVDAGREARRPTLSARRLEALDDVRRRPGREDERHDRGRHHVLPRLENPAEIGDGFGQAHVGGRGVRHAVGVERQQRVRVVGRRHADLSAEPAQVAGVPPDLVGAVHPETDELEIGVIDDAAQRELPDITGAPLDDTMGHAPPCPRSARQVKRRPASARLRFIAAHAAG
jgi:hypothetical protein